jgi:histidyl-tRNA synthetase
VERLLRKLRPDETGSAVERALAFIERLGQVRGAPEETLAGGRRLLAEFGLSDEPLHRLEATLSLLAQHGADRDRVRLDLGLSRGLQYYTGIVFEIHHSGLGAESQLCGGGRYDDLIRALGGRQAVSALGFAFGLERVHLALESTGRAAPPARTAEVFVVAVAAEQMAYANRVAQALRRAGVPTHVDVAPRPLRSALAYADREGFTHAVVVGAEEAVGEMVRVRDMTSGQEESVSLASVAEVAQRGRLPAVGAPRGR